MQEKISQYKKDIYQELSGLTKGLGSEKRIEILNILLQGPKAVDGIAKATGLSVANTSRHLQVLKESHLVNTSRNGNFIRYSLASEKIAQLILLLFDVGEEQFASIRSIEQEYDQESGVKQISLDEALEMSAKDDVMLVDLRPLEEFESGHLPEAINVPLDEFTVRKNELPKDMQIIFYCRGRQCGYANVAAKELQDLGYQTYSLNRSFADYRWR